MKKSLTIFFLACIMLSMTARSQQAALTWSPAYPTVNDNLIIFYNAALGDSNLVTNGVTEVYMHTGLVTKESINLSDWLHKPVKWGHASDTVKMTHLSQHFYTDTIPIATFYPYLDITGTDAETVTAIGFVFRNADGSVAGKDTNHADFFIPIFQPGIFARFVAPLQFPFVPNPGEVFPVKVSCTGNTDVTIFHDGDTVANTYGMELTTAITAAPAGKHWIKFVAVRNSVTVTDSLYYIVKQLPTVADAPAGTRDGINYINGTTVTLQLLAPNKNSVYLIWDNTDFQLDPAFQMNKTTDGQRFWITLTGLVPQKEYRFQYFVENSVKITDPYSEKILDKYGDPGINGFVYPNLITYPAGTSQHVSVFQTEQEPFVWTDGNFQKPDNRDLVIYELLIRDFHGTHSYKTVEDSIRYLRRLGINAIELMPVMEFEGNGSWGYMPTHHFAPDKYYGTKNNLKSLINACHKNGIAVILDLVLNHTSPQNPMAALYYNKEQQKPGADNPWFNDYMPHDYGYPCDMDHESPYTRTYIDSVLNYWVSEYHADGFRLDLSKGFTNTYTIGGAGNMAAYDVSRINNIKRLANVLWAKQPGTFIILEHFADNAEESELANYGFMMWSGGGGNYGYRAAGKGWTSDYSGFEWPVSYQARPFAFHNLVGYMESHDEERLTWDIYRYGNTSNPAYNPRHIDTAINRAGACAAFFLPVPGPKMIWEFGERGYDYSIFFPDTAGHSPNCRMDPKPARWDYMNASNHLKLFEQYAALIYLKKHFPISRTNNYEMEVENWDKRIRLFPYAQSNTNINVVIAGNFKVEDNYVYPQFPHAGTWYDYLSQSTYNVETWQTEANNYGWLYKPGEYHVFIDSNIVIPDSIGIYTSGNGSGISEAVQQDPLGLSVYPNPFSDKQTITYTLPASGTVTIKIINLMGTEVKTIVNTYQTKGTHFLTWDGTNDDGGQLNSGYYFCTIQSGDYAATQKIAFIKN